MELITRWLVETTWQVALLVVVVALVQLAAGRWMSPRARYAMWMIVVLRLAIPVLPASGWSLYGWWGEAERGAAVAHASSVTATPGSGLHAEGVDHFAVNVTVSPSAGAMRDDVKHARVVEAKTDVAAPAEISSASLDWRRAALGIWAGGALLMLVRVAVQSLHGMRLRRQARPLTPDELGLEETLRQRLSGQLPVEVACGDSRRMGILRRLRPAMRSHSSGALAPAPASAGSRLRVAVMESQAIRSPALCGLIRPAILLPAGLVVTLDKDQLEQVIRHELAHVGRRDHWTNAAMRLLHAIHWFNPAVWFAFSRCKLERELACDEAVLRQAESGRRELYGRTLLAMATQLGGTNRQPMLTMAEGKRHLKRRIHSIAAGPKRGRSGVLAVVLAVAIGIAGLTRAQTTVPTAQTLPLPATAPAPVAKPMTYADRLVLKIPELRFDATPLEEVIRVLQDIAGCRIVVDWPALSDHGISRKTPVTMHVKDVSFGKALRVVLDSVSPKGVTIGFRGGDGGISLPTTENLMARLVTRVYNVTDLCFQIPDEVLATPRDQVKNIADLIRQTMAVDTWKENGGSASITPWPSGEQLVIVQDDEGHKAIEALLAQLREALKLQVTVQCQFVCLDPAKLSPKLQAAFKGHDGVYLDDSSLPDLEKAIRATPQWWMANAPRITMFNGGTAKAQALAQTPYVSGYKASRDAAGKTEYQPVMSQTQQGLTVVVRANVSHDRKYVTLYLKPQVVDLVGLETVPWEGNQALSQHLVVQRPNLQERTMETLVSVPDRATVVMGGLAPVGAATRLGAPATQPLSAERVYVVIRPMILNMQSPAATRPESTEAGGK